MIHAARTIVAEDGLRGLWRGTMPAVQRAALVNLGELATYDQVWMEWLDGWNIAERRLFSFWYVKAQSMI